jgi:formylglycine-generating enzyme required for sulfatase activity
VTEQAPNLMQRWPVETEWSKACRWSPDSWLLAALGERGLSVIGQR